VSTLSTPKNICSNFKQSKYFHQRKEFTYCETSSNKVKLPKVGSNAIVPAPVEVGPNKKDEPNSGLDLRAKFKIGNAL
jgi:hypothetical protein